MLFDLEPYLPFNAFVVLVIAALGVLVVWHASRNR